MDQGCTCRHRRMRFQGQLQLSAASTFYEPAPSPQDALGPVEREIPCTMMRRGWSTSRPKAPS